jgi:dynein heavy chain
LNPQALVDGIDEYIKQFKQLPKNIRASEVGKSVEEKMKEFKRSVPLFVDLKHEALRPRHWVTLMNKTGMPLSKVVRHNNSRVKTKAHLTLTSL